VAAKLAKPEGTPAERARLIYDELIKTLNLATGPVPTERTLGQALASGEVSETEYSLIMVGLLRLSGIPARVEYGIALPQEPTSETVTIVGPHVWVGAYLTEGVWTPLDPVAAKAHPEQADYYFGTDCAGRVRFGVGYDITLSPVQLGKPLPIFYMPLAEVDKATLPVEFKVTVRDLAGGAAGRMTSGPKETSP
jgi:transglutaminase-like putative cysteine protease